MYPPICERQSAFSPKTYTGYAPSYWNNALFVHHYLLLSFIICVIFAISDEFHQTFVAGRTGQSLDVLIDSAGALVGLVFYSTYHIVFKSGYKKAKKEMEEN